MMSRGTGIKAHFTILTCNLLTDQDSRRQVYGCDVTMPSNRALSDRDDVPLRIYRGGVIMGLPLRQDLPPDLPAP